MRGGSVGGGGPAGRGANFVAIRPGPGFRPGGRGGFFWGYPGVYGGYYGGFYGGGSYDNAYYLGSSNDAYVAKPALQSDYQSYYPTEQPQMDASIASLTVRVPDDAEIWFDDTKMTTTGTIREFVTPRLEPGKDYSYMVRARWTSANGKVFDQTHKIGFRAGQAVLVDFLTPPRGTSQQPPMDKAP
jgi:uncharacterized protein (TIGR03000 family)